MGNHQAKIMKRFKRLTALLFTCFLAFAPPGTLILGLIFILGLVGNVWLIVGIILILILLGSAWFVARR